jgi:hypothetical protein
LFFAKCVEKTAFFKLGESPFINEEYLTEKGSDRGGRKMLQLIGTHVLKFLYNNAKSPYIPKDGNKPPIKLYSVEGNLIYLFNL